MQHLIKPYSSPNWFTRQGINRKRKLIKSNGLPSFNNAKLVTLTFDRDSFDNPLAAYLKGLEQLRRFTDKVRKVHGKSIPYCWKLEFQNDGWPHWHFIFIHRPKMDIQSMQEFWGYGNVDIQNIDTDKFDYLFKYVAKENPTEGENAIPDWALDLKKRIRFFQPSRGFYTACKKHSKKKDEYEYSYIDQETGKTESINTRYALLIITLREQINRLRTTAQLVTYKYGQVIAKRKIRIKQQYSEVRKILASKQFVQTPDALPQFQLIGTLRTGKYIKEIIESWQKEIITLYQMKTVSFSLEL